jgi:hypothetical protein
MVKSFIFLRKAIETSKVILKKITSNLIRVMGKKMKRMMK